MLVQGFTRERFMSQSLGNQRVRWVRPSYQVGELGFRVAGVRRHLRRDQREMRDQCEMNGPARKDWFTTSGCRVFSAYCPCFQRQVFRYRVCNRKLRRLSNHGNRFP